MVAEGDLIELDVPNKRLELLEDDAILAKRREQLVLPEPYFQRGYGLLYTQHIEQAHLGFDFDFL